MRQHKDTTFIGLEVMGGETPQRTIQAYIETADEMGVKFEGVKLYETTTVGGRSFVRLQTDCGPGVCDALLERGRGVITTLNGSGYVVRLASGRTGGIPASRMQAIPLGDTPYYLGTRHKYWQRQFT